MLCHAQEKEKQEKKSKIGEKTDDKMKGEGKVGETIQPLP